MSHLLPKEMRHLKVFPEKPKYRKEQRHENSYQVGQLVRRLRNIGELIERNVYHWTLIFQNGSRIEIYPTALAAGGSQHAWYFADSLNVLEFCELSSERDRMEPDDEDDGFDVLEDFE